MKKILSLVLFLIMYSSFPSELSVSLLFDSLEVEIGESLEFQVKVQGEQEVKIVEIKGREHFKIESYGRSSSYQIVNFGSPEIIHLYSFTLVGLREGSFEFGPVIVESNGKRSQSHSVTLKIFKETPSSTVKMKDFFVEAKLTKLSAYVSEQLIYSLKVYSKNNILNPSLELPPFTGFWKEQLGEITHTQIIKDGYPFNLSEIHFALFPLNVGKLVIGSASLHGKIYVADKNKKRPRSQLQGILNTFMKNTSFDRHLKTRNVKIKSRAVEVDVRPLPRLNKPGIFSGLVGHFNIHAQIDKNQVKRGSSVNLRISVEGRGNLFDLDGELFSLKNIKIYRDKPQFNKKRDSLGIFGEKIFQMALVPQKAELFTIPSLELIIFDTTLNDYVTLKTEKIYLNILEGEERERGSSKEESNSPLGKKRKIEILGEDIMPNRSSGVTLQSKVDFSKKIYALYALIFLLPSISLIGYFLQKKKDYQYSHSSALRESKAYKIFKKRINSVGNNEHYIEESSLILKDYLGDKLNLDGRSITLFDLQRILAPRNISHQVIEDVTDVLRSFDQVKFGKMSQSFTFRTLMTDMKKIVYRLDKEMK